MDNYKSKIKDVRAAIPVPMSEALQLLKKHEGDADKAIAEAKAINIASICTQTGCGEKEAAKVYKAEKYDLNRTISVIREKIYDKNYRPIDGITREGIKAALDWMHIVSSKDFVTALDYQKLTPAIDTLHKIASLKDMSVALQEAKRVRDILLANENEMTNEEFIKQNTILDVHPASVRGIEMYRMKETVMKEELLRHFRNLH